MALSSGFQNSFRKIDLYFWLKKKKQLLITTTVAKVESDLSNKRKQKNKTNREVRFHKMKTTEGELNAARANEN